MSLDIKDKELIRLREIGLSFCILVENRKWKVPVMGKHISWFML